MEEKINNLNDLFVEQLRDRYDAAIQQETFYRLAIEKVHDHEMRQAIRNQQETSQDSKRLLENIFTILNEYPTGEKCEGTGGLIHEAWELNDRATNSDVRDCGLIVSMQHIKHHDIAGYGSCLAFARNLALDEVCDVLEKILQQEKTTDSELSNLSAGHLNRMGLQKTSS